MYLRTALVLLACLALTVDAEDAKPSDVSGALLNHYDPQPYGYGSCARRRQQYQEQYGSSGHHEHHEHDDGYEGEHRQHHDYNNDGYSAEAAAQSKGSDAKKDDAKTANTGSGADTKTTADAKVPAQLLSSGSKPAAAHHDSHGNSLEHLLHQQNPRGHYIEQRGLGSHMFPGYTELLEDGQMCMNDWACCSGKCSDNACCPNEKLSSGQACLNNINCCSNSCVALNAATPLVKTCCRTGGAATGRPCTLPTDCCSNNCRITDLGAVPICCPPGTVGDLGPCTSNAQCCGSDRGSFCNGIGTLDGGRCCPPGLIANGETGCTNNAQCCSNNCNTGTGTCEAAL